MTSSTAVNWDEPNKRYNLASFCGGKSMVLLDAKAGSTVRIVAYRTEAGLEAKLRQLGLIPGDCARILRKAPLGGPVLLEMGGREIALGESIALLIEVSEE
jgi:ferrous iron transport protein A